MTMTTRSANLASPAWSAPAERSGDGAIELLGPSRKPNRRRASLTAAVHMACLFLFAAAVSVPAASLTPAQNEFFEKKIRPVLAGECYTCHSAKKSKGDR